ncbi:hypothetical protein [Sphingomonas sp.]|jgi:hypothetical protein|uniref:hypothetical protein n=1 Tax=Sphingomonas sp. TaxID=28214 RepID=UPI002ED8DC32
MTFASRAALFCFLVAAGCSTDKPSEDRALLEELREREGTAMQRVTLCHDTGKVEELIGAATKTGDGEKNSEAVDQFTSGFYGRNNGCWQFRGGPFGLIKVFSKTATVLANSSMAHMYDVEVSCPDKVSGVGSTAYYCQGGKGRGIVFVSATGEGASEPSSRSQSTTAAQPAAEAEETQLVNGLSDRIAKRAPGLGTDGFYLNYLVEANDWRFVGPSADQRWYVARDKVTRATSGAVIFPFLSVSGNVLYYLRVDCTSREARSIAAFERWKPVEGLAAKVYPPSSGLGSVIDQVCTGRMNDSTGHRLPFDPQVTQFPSQAPDITSGEEQRRLDEEAGASRPN